MMRALAGRFRRRAKVSIVCPHGTFIPGTYRLGRPASRYGCERCAFTVTVSTHRGEVTW
jgi:hypothetical protein